MKTVARTLREIYRLLEHHFGPTHWWPGDTPFEIAVGAILTQNTAWTNVERAIANLKSADLLDPVRMLECEDEILEQALRPSGYFRVKTRRLRSFCRHLVDHYDGSMAKMAERPMPALREEILCINGIGPETADDILLYALDKVVFVVDAYTRRILSRHGVCAGDIGYEDLRALFERNLRPDLQTFREYHGLIVYCGKDFCRTRPKCDGCPLEKLKTVGL